MFVMDAKGLELHSLCYKEPLKLLEQEVMLVFEEAQYVGILVLSHVWN